MKIKSNLTLLIERAEDFGLSKQDINNATEMLKYNEYDHCIYIILTQLYEYDIKIDNDFYNLAMEALFLLKINVDEYKYLKELLN